MFLDYFFLLCFGGGGGVPPPQIAPSKGGGEHAPPRFIWLEGRDCGLLPLCLLLVCSVVVMWLLCFVVFRVPASLANIKFILPVLLLYAFFLCLPQGNREEKGFEEVDKNSHGPWSMSESQVFWLLYTLICTRSPGSRGSTKSGWQQISTNNTASSTRRNSRSASRTSRTLASGSGSTSARRLNILGSSSSHSLRRRRLR